MITALVGGQFGSEGKGAIAAHLASQYNVHVRVGAANAGHTAYSCFEDGKWEKHVMQQLPCAAYCNPRAALVLGAGAMISKEILLGEIEKNVAWRRRKGFPELHLMVDERAHTITDQQKADEQDWDLEQSIGSTSTIAKEGIGAAQAARAARVYYRTIEQEDAEGWSAQLPPGCRVEVVDTVEYLHEMRAWGAYILLEGTQGTSLSNTTGFYPYVTSRNVTATGLAADVGFGPRDLEHVIMVCRSYPIRVAGNSGPFWSDSAEIDWADIGIDSDLERTTVTKKVRRVATMSYKQLRYNARLNSATRLALTFADYLNPEFALAEPTGHVTQAQTDNWDGIAEVMRQMERCTGLPVSLVGVGPHHIFSRLA